MQALNFEIKFRRKQREKRAFFKEGSQVTMDDFGDVLWELNLVVVYGLAVVFAGLVAIYRAHPDDVPRPLALFSWYAVISMATVWIGFHLLYYSTHNPRDVGLAVIARGLSFVPVYICATIAAFLYPRFLPAA